MFCCFIRRQDMLASSHCQAPIFTFDRTPNHSIERTRRCALSSAVAVHGDFVRVAHVSRYPAKIRRTSSRDTQMWSHIFAMSSGSSPSRVSIIVSFPAPTAHPSSKWADLPHGSTRTNVSAHFMALKSEAKPAFAIGWSKAFRYSWAVHSFHCSSISDQWKPLSFGRGFLKSYTRWPSECSDRTTSFWYGFLHELAT